MSFPEFNRANLRFESLATRDDRVYVERDFVDPDADARPLGEAGNKVLAECIDHILSARDADRPRMLVFGAHTIKNGLAPVITRLLEEGWITHLATNGAGIIHDWEFAYQGHSSEHVAENVAAGRFGLWEETGKYLNLALAVGAYEKRGYGESIGSLVERGGLEIPAPVDLQEAIGDAIRAGDTEWAAAAADLLGLLVHFNIGAGWLEVEHSFKPYGLQAVAFRMGIPFTGHPMIGHDIIYQHPMNCCAAIGRTAQRDFLRFAHQVSQLEGGVYMSIGSAVMSPMIFEKSLSMAQNIAAQGGQKIQNHYMMVVDLQASHWDWSQGEPPEDNPDYYLRFNKSFSRMGGTLRYLSADNADFLLHLWHGLRDARK